MFNAGIIASRAAAPPAPIARQYFFAQNLGDASNTDSTAWTTHVTLTATLDNGAAYVAFWTGEARIEGTVNPFPITTVDLRLQQDGVTLDDCRFQNKSTSSLGWEGVNKFAIVTGTGAATTLTFDFRRHIDGSDNIARLRNGRIVLLRLEAGDEYAEDLPLQSSPGDTFGDFVTLSFTPATAGSYLILGGGSGAASVTNRTIFRLYDGSLGTPEITIFPLTANDRIPLVIGWVRLGLSGPQDFTLQARSHNPGADAFVQSARVLALRLDGFTHAYHAELNADTAGGDDSYLEVLGLTRKVADTDFMVISTWAAQDTGSGDLIYGAFVDPSATLNEAIGEVAPPGHWTGFTASIGAYSAGFRHWSLQTKAPDPSDPGSVVDSSAVIAVFQLT